ncbi:hypothetical protein [Mameliella sp. MMSF_3455]|uniref:hypothetical protein n=1 Tax=Mameliella sp. MMSF_3455 TaxID=3046714 RepID=UPI00273D976A|nr:hypothetical protein [Mameliella sp. MMSF_3455]
MTDKPILFSGPMVRALLDGRKTQTRRVAKITAVMGDKVGITSPNESLIELEPGEFHKGIFHYESVDALSGPCRLPYAIGDRLWVREAWRTSRHYDDLKPSEMGGEEPVQYIADGAVYAHAGSVDDLSGRARPSMFMPRWASRLTLIVTDVRVQRVQEISNEDAKAEGCKGDLSRIRQMDLFGASEDDREMMRLMTCGWQFRDLWDGLNARRGYGWDVNPWVAAYTFKVHRQNIDQMTDTLQQMRTT